jgi:hypothetical protein
MTIGEGFDLVFVGLVVVCGVSGSRRREAAGEKFGCGCRVLHRPMAAAGSVGRRERQLEGRRLL